MIWNIQLGNRADQRVKKRVMSPFVPVGGLSGNIGLLRTGLLAGGLNYANQKFAGYADNQPFSGTSVGISTASSLLTSGIMSNVPAGAASPAALESASSALNWVVEQPPQIINSGMQKMKGNK